MRVSPKLHFDLDQFADTGKLNLKARRCKPCCNPFKLCFGPAKLIALHFRLH